MIKVGITGGIGSGKSMVCKIFKHLGIPIYDSDNRARFLQENNIEIISKTKALLGLESYFENGLLNRNYVREMVFSNNDLRLKLNQIVHPIVINDALNWFTNQYNFPYAIKESALLFSANIHTKMDVTIAVFSPLELRIQRILERDKSKTEKDILSIIESQKEQEKMLENADFKIFNNENQLILPQILYLDKDIRNIKV
ncbi:MAG: dephospho-CoA kinase [Cytophagales bacterium]|nr:MAG: dephospho-CoA kinase [Cytophagales bacterium]